MSITPQLRGTWKASLRRQSSAAQRAQDDLLVGIYEATETGVTQADIADAVGDSSPSGIKAKAAKGKKILEARKR